MGTISEEIRKRLQSTEETFYRVAKETGLAWSTINRFANGGVIRGDHLDRLAEYFRLTVCERESKSKR